MKGRGIPPIVRRIKPQGKTVTWGELLCWCWMLQSQEDASLATPDGASSPLPYFFSKLPANSHKKVTYLNDRCITSFNICNQETMWCSWWRRTFDVKLKVWRRTALIFEDWHKISVHSFDTITNQVLSPVRKANIIIFRTNCVLIFPQRWTLRLPYAYLSV